MPRRRAVLGGIAAALALGLGAGFGTASLAAADAMPNDPWFPIEWWLSNTGTNGPNGPNGPLPVVAGADIGGPAGWGRALAAGLDPVVVGVVEQSIESDDDEFAPRLLANPGEVARNGADDDGNGRIDDVFGFAFGSGVGIQQPQGNETGQYGTGDHGDTVTSLLAATWGDAHGMAGAAPNAQVVLGLAPGGLAVNVAEAIRYVARRGARVINVSQGTAGSFGTQLCPAVAEAAASGALVVAAAGNEATDNDQTHFWPADCEATGLSVAATSAADQLSSFSNWGATTVDLAAPGQSMLLCLGCSGRSGTSFSAPLVSGAAAVLFGVHPEATAAQVRQALIEGAEPFAADPARPIAGGRLDLDRALVALDRILAPLATAPGPGSGSTAGAARARPLARIARRSAVSRRVVLLLDAPAGARAVSIRIGSRRAKNYKIKARIVLRLPARPGRHRITVRFMPGGSNLVRVALLLSRKGPKRLSELSAPHSPPSSGGSARGPSG